MTTDNQTQDVLATTYNELPYVSAVFWIAQPERLRTIAKMKGFNPPALEQARVLEIGCSFGGNLLPFAIQFPKSHIVGVDLSEHQINVAREMFQSVGVENVEFIAGDISQLHFEQKFDYIICHGVFSWVPEQVQQAILKSIQTYLAPTGVAYISYNTYPGWKNKDVIKDLMNFGSDSNAKPIERYQQAMAMLQFVKSNTEQMNIAYQQQYPWLNRVLEHNNISYITHEYLETYNQPMYFKEFLKLLEAHELSYMADSSVPANLMSLNGQYQQYVNICQYFNYNATAIEQYLDFAYNTAFRCSIITHQQAAQEANFVNHIDRRQRCHELKALNVRILTQKTTDDEGKEYWIVNHPQNKYQNADLQRRLFEYCQQSGKQLFKAQELIDYFEQLNGNDSETEALIQLLIHISHAPSAYSTFENKPAAKLGRKPKLNPKYVALAQFIKNNPNITTLSNQYYQEIASLDLISQYLLPFIDGTRSVKDLIAVLKDAFVEQYLVLLDSEKQPTDPKDIKEQALKEQVEDTIANLNKLGWFNHYD